MIALFATNMPIMAFADSIIQSTAMICEDEFAETAESLPFVPIDNFPESYDIWLFVYIEFYFADDTTKSVCYFAPYYDPSIGRFISEDPALDGYNWYAYCGGNPIKFADKNGMEKIVVSGGTDGSEKFKYSFIETAIKQIRDWQSESSESISWHIAYWNYNIDDLYTLREVANMYDVKIRFMHDKQNLLDYINKDGREYDKITSMSFFAHGSSFDQPASKAIPNPGYENKYAIAMGYSHVKGTPHNNNLNIFASDLSKINSSAFSSSCHTNFGACRTGNIFDGVSFAQEWANMTGGSVRAATGKDSTMGRTDYTNIYTNL